MLEAAMARRKTTRIGPVLEELVDRLEFRSQLREYAVWNVWSEVVGAILAARSEPLRIEDGKLFIRVGGSAWMQELQFLKDDIRTRLNQRLGAPIVKDLFFVLGRVTRPQRREPAPPAHPVDESRVTSLVPDVGHPEIENAIRRVARARARRFGPRS